MFDSDFFEKWLDEEAQKSMAKLSEQKQLTSNEMMVLMLKAQTNHITHLEQDLREEMIALRKDMDIRFGQVDKRFDRLEQRFYSFMLWSFSTTVAVGGIVVSLIKFL